MVVLSGKAEHYPSVEPEAAAAIMESHKSNVNLQTKFTNYFKFRNNYGCGLRWDILNDEGFYFYFLLFILVFSEEIFSLKTIITTSLPNNIGEDFRKSTYLETLFH